MCSQSARAVITTIIPTYRRPRLLRRAISSVLRQTFPDFQVWILDNASGDETADVVAELARSDPRVRYHCHPENIGALKNLVFGVKQVETPYFSFLSDDDILLPDFYRIALNGFEKHPDAMLSAAACIIVDDRGTVLGATTATWREGYYPPPEGLVAMLNHEHPTWTSVLFRRETLDQVGCLDEEVGMALDLDFELRVAARFPIVVSRQPGAIFVSHELSASYSCRFHHTWPGWLKIVQNMRQDELIAPDARLYAERVLVERLKRRLFLSIGFGSILRRNWEDAYGAAEVLQTHYGQSAKARVLRAMATTCKLFRPAHYALRGLSALRRLYRRYNAPPLQAEYRSYARLLQL